MHEASLHERNAFITLTYDDEHLPIGGTLVKHHYQDFMKRLRWRFRKDTIRFFHCGEYGEQLTRPHYHALLFGFDLPDRVHLTGDGQHELSTSEILAELWRRGFTTVGNVTFDSAAYVARYVTKKITGPDAEEHYNGKEPEYVTMSRRPGIAREWFEEYADDTYRDDNIISNGHPAKPPRYYDKLFEAAHGPKYEQVKRARRRAIKTTENTPERLRVRETCATARLTLKKRKLDT